MAQQSLTGEIPNVFGEYLAPQTYTGAQMRPSGFMGGAGRAAYYVDSFLQGLSRGRMLSAARAEQQKVNSERSLLMAIKAVANSSLPDTVKQDQAAGLYKMLAGTILGSIDNGKKNGGTGEKGQHENHFVAGLKTILRGIAGPGAEKQAYTPDQIESAVNRTFTLIQNANNNLRAQTQNADARLQQIYSSMYSPDGKPPSQDQLNRSKEWNQALGAAMQLTNGQPTPFLQSVAQAAKEREGEATAAWRQSEIERNQAEAEAIKRRGVKLFQNSQGETFSFDGAVYRDASGNIVAGNDPRLQGLHAVGVARAPQRFTTKLLRDGTIGKYDAQGNFLGLLLGPNGKPATQSTPEGRIAIREGYVNERFNQGRSERNQRATTEQQARATEETNRINRFYDAERLRVEQNPSISDDDKNTRIADIEDRRKRELQALQQPQATSPTTPPPPGRAAAAQTKTPPPPQSGKSAAPPKQNAKAAQKIATESDIEAYMRLRGVSRAEAIKAAKDAGYEVKAQ